MTSEMVLRLLIVLYTLGTAIGENEEPPLTEKCVETSQYMKPQKGKPCKDLGSCYRYRCGAIARHCSECEARKGPCLEDSPNEPSPQRRSKRSTGGALGPLNDVSSSPDLSSFLESLRSRLTNLIDQVQGVVSVPDTPTVVPVENIGNALVHIRAGSKNCTGFIATVDGPQGKKHLILTAAQCLVKFETECRSALETFGSKFTADPNSQQIVDGYMTYAYKHSWPCFGDYDSDINKVKKSYRSYTVIVTSYAGRTFNIPLTWEHVIVPSDYMECQDCRYDFAAIKLKDNEAQEMLRSQQPFALNPDKNPTQSIGDDLTQFVTVSDTPEPKTFQSATESKFCTISYTTNDKMCFKLPIPLNVDNPPKLLPGSPLFVAAVNSLGQTEYQCVGIFTGSYNIVEENHSTDYLLDDEIAGSPFDESLSVSVRYSKNGAVRITQKLVSFLEKLSGTPMMRIASGENSQLRPLVLPARRAFFPNVLDPYNTAKHLYLCELGWKDERNHCRKPDFELSQGCTWDGYAFVCVPRKRNNESPSNKSTGSIFENIMIPGTTKRLSISGQNIDDSEELETVLRHLPDLEELILDDNYMTELQPTLFSGNPKLRLLSIKNNGIARIKRGVFSQSYNLRHLNLAENKIRGLSEEMLSRSTKLEHFNVENNNIKFVSQNVFKNIAGLKQFSLGNNNLIYIAGKLLHRQLQLKEFRVNNNSLLRIPNGLLNSNRMLSLVDFSSNRLSVVARNLFDHNPHLQYVNLNHNNIVFMPYRLFSNQRNLVAVNASANPLKNGEQVARYFRSARVPYN